MIIDDAIWKCFLNPLFGALHPLIYTKDLKDDFLMTILWLFLQSFHDVNDIRYFLYHNKPKWACDNRHHGQIMFHHIYNIFWKWDYILLYFPESILFDLAKANIEDSTYIWIYGGTKDHVDRTCGWIECHIWVWALSFSKKIVKAISRQVTRSICLWCNRLLIESCWRRHWIKDGVKTVTRSRHKMLLVNVPLKCFKKQNRNHGAEAKKVG